MGLRGWTGECEMFGRSLGCWVCQCGGTEADVGEGCLGLPHKGMLGRAGGWASTVLGATTEQALRGRAARRDGVAADYGEAYKLRLYAAAGVTGTPLVLEQGGRVGRTFLAAVRKVVQGASVAAAAIAGAAGGHVRCQPTHQRRRRLHFRRLRDRGRETGV